jgi:hypothetical protein
LPAVRVHLKDTHQEALCWSHQGAAGSALLEPLGCPHAPSKGLSSCLQGGSRRFSLGQGHAGSLGPAGRAVGAIRARAGHPAGQPVAMVGAAPGLDAARLITPPRCDESDTCTALESGTRIRKRRADSYQQEEG